MGGSRSATSEEGVSLLWEAQACRGGLFDHHRLDHLQRGHFTPSVPRKGTCPECTPTPACLCLPLCGGSRRINHADKNAVTSRGTTSPATMPALPRSLSNIQTEALHTRTTERNARPERRMSPKGKKSEAAASV